jgi:hypothetical protein
LKIAKAFVALLFSFALLAGQFSFAKLVETPKQPKGCCTKHCCCAKSTDSNSAPLPVVPAQSLSQTDWQLAASIAQHIVSTIAPFQHRTVSSGFVLLDFAAVPLYERHCSFLI